MHILFLISGNAPTILHECAQAGISIDKNDVDEIKLEEKGIAALGRVLGLIRQKPYQSIIWGCRDVRFQRFQSLMMVYMFLTFKNGIIADEQGMVRQYSLTRFLFRDVPSMLLELAIGLFVVCFAFTRLPFLRKKLLAKQHKTLIRAEQTRVSALPKS